MDTGKRWSYHAAVEKVTIIEALAEDARAASSSHDSFGVSPCHRLTVQQLLLHDLLSAVLPYRGVPKF